MLRKPPERSPIAVMRVDWFLALVSASFFGLSGSLARSLMDLGWSPAAVVATRVGGAFLILLIPSLLLLRRIGLPTGRQAVRILAYGVVAIALAQLCYFSAVQYLSVGVALLLEYLAPVMLIGWHWARTHRRPAWPVLAGAGLSIVGLAFVLDLRDGLTLNPIGVAWGLGAALCLCAYFLLSEDNGADAPDPPAAADHGRHGHRSGCSAGCRCSWHPSAGCTRRGHDLGGSVRRLVAPECCC